LGLIVTEVAIAPAYPAEFVVFRFSHKRLSE
jgi:phage tail sheath protein FI